METLLERDQLLSHVLPPRSWPSLWGLNLPPWNGSVNRAYSMLWYYLKRIWKDICTNTIYYCLDVLSKLISVCLYYISMATSGRLDVHVCGASVDSTVILCFLCYRCSCTRAAVHAIKQVVDDCMGQTAWLTWAVCVLRTLMLWTCSTWKTEFLCMPLYKSLTKCTRF